MSWDDELPFPPPYATVDPRSIQSAAPSSHHGRETRSSRSSSHHDYRGSSMTGYRRPKGSHISPPSTDPGSLRTPGSSFSSSAASYQEVPNKNSMHRHGSPMISKDPGTQDQQMDNLGARLAQLRLPSNQSQQDATSKKGWGYGKDGQSRHYGYSDRSFDDYRGRGSRHGGPWHRRHGRSRSSSSDSSSSSSDSDHHHRRRFRGRGRGRKRHHGHHRRDSSTSSSDSSSSGSSSSSSDTGHSHRGKGKARAADDDYYLGKAAWKTEKALKKADRKIRKAIDKGKRKAWKHAGNEHHYQHKIERAQRKVQRKLDGVEAKAARKMSRGHGRGEWLRERGEEGKMDTGVVKSRDQLDSDKQAYMPEPARFNEKMGSSEAMMVYSKA